MKMRIISMGVLALAAAMAASSSVRAPRLDRLHGPVPAGAARLQVFGARSREQLRSPAAAKFDGALAEIVRTAGRVDPAQALAELRARSPAVRFAARADGAPLVSIDAVTRGDPQRLRAALEGLGLEKAAVYNNDVGGWLPVARLEAAAARTEVHALRAAMSRTRSGAVTSQGDFVQRSAAVRSSTSLSGAGITVGLLSDSFDCYAQYAAPGSGVPVSGYAGYAYNGFTATQADDVASGDLPATVDVLAEATCANYGAPIFTPFGDEGRAMAQIVHDVAPGAALSFYTAENSEADFASGIGALQTAGARVIVDDVGYFDEPFYQDGIVAQAVDAVVAKGVAYFSAAGNEGHNSYENLAPSFATLSNSAPNAGEYLLNFDTSGATTATALPITIDAMQPGVFTAVVVEWDQPYVTGAPNSGGATSQVDVCITGATSAYTVLNSSNTPATCSGANAVGSDPVQVLIIANPANATASTNQETLSLMVGLANGTTAPGRVKVVVETDGQLDPPITTYATNSATIQGHAGAAGAATVGAAFYFNTPACGTAPATLENFSSRGGSPVLFDVNGVRLASATVRDKPDFVAPDGVNDTFLGFTLAAAGITGTNGLLSTSVASCQNDPSYPNFFGTSAAAPHAGAMAALFLEANSSLTPTQIYSALRSSALSMSIGTPTPYDYDNGAGFIQADAALALLPAAPPPAPTLAAAPPTLTLGASATLTWSSVNATGCTASGGWSGALAVSGSQSVTPASAGTATYSLSCSNAAGASPVASATVTVNAPPSHSGGGGMDWATLMAIAGLAALRFTDRGCRTRRRVRARTPSR